MTTPTPVAPSKLKTWVALAGSALAFVVPLLVSAQDYLPAPWPAVVGGGIALLTALGVYHTPYTASGSVVVPTPVAQSLPPVVGEFKNPWTLP